MKRLSFAFLTKDRVDLSERSLAALRYDDIDLWWIDGSQTEKGKNFHANWNFRNLRSNVTGGADKAIVYALTTLLNETDTPYVGICENDVLLHPDWLGPTLALFDRGRVEGLDVGAVSARAYEDRVLCQRDGYALMHNLGSGHIILTRHAARLLLDHYRSAWSTENRRVFQTLSGIDIGKYWAFRGSPHFLTVDWGFDRVLASHGLASLALTPSMVEMIGQDPPLEAQGLKLVTEPVELLRNDEAFARFVERTCRIRDGDLALNGGKFYRFDDGSQMIFAHQIGAINGRIMGVWRTKWSQGCGPFAYVAAERNAEEERIGMSRTPQMIVPVSGPCEFWVSGGGTEHGRFELTDTRSGYSVSPELPSDPNQIVQLAVPGFGWRDIRLTALTPGVVFYGIATHEPQPYDPTWTFDYSVLPPTA